MLGIRHEDILSTMHSLNLIKYWKGQHVINLSEKVLQNYISQKKKMRLCIPDNLIWSPPDNKVNGNASSSGSSSSNNAIATSNTNNNGSAMKKK